MTVRERRAIESSEDPAALGRHWGVEAWRAILAVDRLVRLHFLNFSSWLVLLGAASVAPELGLGRIAVLLGVALCFHIYAYVLNDVIDLPVDRTQPSRAEDPLVTGEVQPWQALALALVQVPLTLPLHMWLGGRASDLAVLALGFLLMAVYNVWGKRCFFPPLTDLVQGIAWGCLALYGALVSADSLNLLSWVVFGSGAGFIFLINGVHGGLRDLDNDLASGKRTTSIFFGARRDEEVGIRIPTGLVVFAWLVQIVLMALLLLPFVGNQIGYGSPTLQVMLAVAVLFVAVDGRYMALVFRPKDPAWGPGFRIHMFFLLFGPLVVLWPHLGNPMAIVVPAMFFLPSLLFPTTHDLIRRLVRGR